MRFDSWTEFGIHYALIGGNNIRQWKIFDAKRILPNLFFYFLAPSQITSQFPFFHLTPSFPWRLPNGYVGPYPVAGVLTTMPFLNILFLSPIVFSRGIKHPNRFLIWTIGCFISLALAVACLVSALSAVMRYVMDFVGLLLLAAIVLWFCFDEHLARQKGRRILLRVLAAILIIYGCIFNAAISMVGDYNLFKTRNPEAYRWIEGLFVPFQRVIAGYSSLVHGSSLSYGPITMRVKFSSPTPWNFEPLAGKSEPLIMTGRFGLGDCVYVRYLGNNVLAFGFDHWGKGGPVSPPIRVNPEAIYDLEIHMGSLYPRSPSSLSGMFPDANFPELKDLLLVKLNGKEVLRGRLEFHDAAPSDVMIGKNVAGGGQCAQYFSGVIIAASRIPPKDAGTMARGMHQ